MDLKKLLKLSTYFYKKAFDADFLKNLIQPGDKIVLSSNPITKINPESQLVHGKPIGLWYACGDEWVHWYDQAYTSGTFDEQNYKFCYKITVSKTVLRIHNSKDFLEFEKKYMYTEPGDKEGMIDWPKVSEDYDGIEICPYRGQKIGWYFGWDVASGCIWRQEGLASINLIAEMQDGVWTKTNEYEYFEKEVDSYLEFDDEPPTLKNITIQNV